MATIRIYDGYPEDGDACDMVMSPAGRVFDELDNEACMRRAGLPLTDMYMVVGGKAIACSFEEFSRSVPQQTALAVVPAQRTASPDFRREAVA